MLSPEYKEWVSITLYLAYSSHVTVYRMPYDEGAYQMRAIVGKIW